MKEYIERAEAIKRIKEYSLTAYDINLDNKEEFAGNSLAENYCEGLYEATELLDDLPAADVAEVRHGRWIPEICDSISKRNRLIEYKVYSCSLCGRSNGRIKKKYCPNCGALMKEDEHEAR